MATVFYRHCLAATKLPNVLATAVLLTLALAASATVAGADGEITIKAVAFTGNIPIFKDLGDGNAPASIPEVVWTDGGVRERAGYAGGDRIRAKVTFFSSGGKRRQAVVEGEVAGLGKLSRTGVNIPAQGEFTVPNIQSAFRLDRKTRFFDPMTIKWKIGGQFVGETRHQIYVTLRPPLEKVFLTTIHLAVSRDGATDQAGAFRNTWNQFSLGGAGPTNVTTWDARPLYYYRNDPAGGTVVGFNGCATEAEEFLRSTSGSGQCGAFALLLKASLAVNGIPSDVVEVDAKDATNFLVKDWTFAAVPAFPPAKWKIEFNQMALDAGDLMVPKQPGDKYGDLTNLKTLAGQNTMPPSEKVFGRHYIVKFNNNGKLDCTTADCYYDPSYGVTYLNEDDFEGKAVDGYMDDRNPADAATVFRVRKSTGLKNIAFDK